MFILTYAIKAQVHIKPFYIAFPCLFLWSEIVKIISPDLQFNRKIYKTNSELNHTTMSQVTIFFYTQIKQLRFKN